MSFYRDPAEASVNCTDRSMQIPMLACLDCSKFPCGRLTKENLATIEASAFVTKTFLGFKARRRTMYIFKLKSGEYTDAYPGFTVDNPDFSKMSDVEEVLVISKALVPKMKLVVKPLNERSAIRQELSKDKDEAHQDEAKAETPKKTRRRAKKD